jgi:hypothetical protein
MPGHPDVLGLAGRITMGEKCRATDDPGKAINFAEGQCEKSHLVAAFWFMGKGPIGDELVQRMHEISEHMAVAP